MKSTKITYKMAFQVWLAHGLLCAEYTGAIFAVIYVVGLFIMPILGKPVDFLYFREHHWLVLLCAFIVYAIPVSICVIKRLMDRQYDGFRMITLLDE